MKLIYDIDIKGLDDDKISEENSNKKELELKG